jgi:tetratricopeptide (TPR) repeat protein
MKYSKGFEDTVDDAPKQRSSYEQAIELQRLGYKIEAEILYRQAVIEHPENWESHYRLGILLNELEDPFAAEAPLRRAAALAPRNANISCDLALVLETQGKLTEAEAICQDALSINPNLPEAWNNLGNLSIARGRLQEAEAHFRRAIALRPKYLDAHNNLGNVLQELGRYQESLKTYQEVLHLQPDHLEANANQAHVYLALGDFQNGWEKYELRLKAGERETLTFNRPLWRESLDSKRTLLITEQSFGDTFQFIRYAKLLAERGSRVFVQCRIPEYRLLQSCPAISQVFMHGESLPDFDTYAFLLSMPKLLGTRLETIPSKVPYLYAPKLSTLSESLQQQVNQAQGYKIGLVWAASVQRFIDRKRACPISHFEALFSLPNISWFSLYKGSQLADLEAYSQIIELGSHFKDFADTAWAISQLDLVITVDTSVAHLAGAMGKEVWILLPWVTDWQWLSEQQDTPWYPTARLFRQAKAGDWHSVIIELGNALCEKLGLPTPIALRLKGTREIFLSDSDLSLLQAHRLATKHRDAGRLDRAIGILQFILQQKPDHYNALHDLGSIYFLQRNFAASESFLRESVSLRPHDGYTNYSLALTLGEQSKYIEAEKFCLLAVKWEPEYAEAFNTLGNLQATQRKFMEAESSYRRAINLRPNFAGTLNNLANVLAEQGRLEEALACYKQALSINPDLEDAQQNYARLLAQSNYEPLLLRANEAYQSGNYQKAEALYLQILAFRPSSAEVHTYLGTVLSKQGRSLEAEVSHRQAIALKPDLAEAHYNLGDVLSSQGQFPQAETSLKRACLLKADFAEAHYKLGTILEWIGYQEEAEASFRAAIDADPSLAEAHGNLGTLLASAQRYPEAATYFRQYVAQRPNSVEGLIALGDSLIAMGHLLNSKDCIDEADTYFRKAIDLEPKQPAAHTSLGLSLMERGQFAEAKASYNQALSLAPERPEIHFNLSQVLFLEGNSQRAWEEYEWRWQTSLFQGHIPLFPQPRWDGSSLSGRSILLWPEQGFGDTIQFIRYAASLKATGGKVLFFCKEPLVRLFSSYPGIDQLIYHDERRGNNALPDFDVHVPLMSLPHLLGAETIPADIPYLHAPDTCSLPDDLQQKLKDTAKRKVGIVWSSLRVVANHAKRHCPLDLLAPLLELPNLSWFSLYKGNQINDLVPYSDQVTDLGSHFHDFADTAWAISQLDLVISIDTSVAHLAGAMGKETWVLLPFVPDWRWLLDRKDSPWYPSVLLFRQPALGDWQSVVAQLKASLTRRIGQKLSN